MNIGIYVRKSVYTEIGESIENQVILCKKYIENKYMNELLNIEIFSDDCNSGKDIERIQLKKMIYLIQNKKINIVVVYRLDRLSRNINDFTNLLEMFENNNVKFISVKEEFDTTKPIGKAMLYMATIFAQLERETIAERVKDNMYLLAKKGYWLGGNLPTGYKSEKYKIDNKIKYKLVLNNDEKEIVKLIYKLMIERKSISKVKEFLKQNDIKSKNGNEFSNNSIREILLNPVYCKMQKEIFDYFEEKQVKLNFNFIEEKQENGLIVFGKRKYNKTNILKEDIKNWVIAQGEHKGIINAKDWIYIQNFFNNKKIHKPHNEISLLSGKIICNSCKNKMIFKANSNIKNNGNFYYICKTKIKDKSLCNCKNINGKQLDNIIWKLINEKYKIYINKDYFKEKDNIINIYKKEIKKIINCIKKLENEIVIKELEKEVTILQQKIKELEKETNINENINIFEKRNFIDKYIKEIIWNNLDIQIVFK